MEDLGELLAELVARPGLSGGEEAVADLAARELAAAGCEVRRDRLGNVIARRPPDDTGTGRPPRLLIAAHLDQIGLLVARIEPGGFLRVAASGGVDPRVLLGREVVVHGARALPGVIGLKPPHLTRPEERERVVPIDELFVDTGLPEEEVRRLVRVGHPVRPAGPLRRLLGERVAGAGLDDRAGVAVLIVVARELTLRRLAVEVILAATVQEEVGLRGAAVAAHGLAPDAALAVDVGFADQPGVPAHAGFRLGGGPVIARGPNVHPEVFDLLVAAAKREAVPYQVEPAPGSTGTDAWAMQVAAGGTATGVVSIPLRSMHSAAEVADLGDVRAAARLLVAAAAGFDGARVEGWRDAAGALE